MKKLYYKNEIAFALLCILAYVAAIGAAGGEMPAALIVRAVFAALLCVFAVKNGLAERCGLCGTKHAPHSACYIPAALVVSSALWFGVRVNGTAAEWVSSAALMAVAAFAEELLFRGFLLHALRGKGVRTAACLSSLCFGAVHLLNLFGSADVTAVLCQGVCAAAVGALLAWLTVRSGSLLPCVLTHGALNVLSLFENTALAERYRVPQAAAVVTISLAGCLLLRNPARKNRVPNIRTGAFRSATIACDGSWRGDERSLPLPEWEPRVQMKLEKQPFLHPRGRISRLPSYFPPEIDDAVRIEAAESDKQYGEHDHPPHAPDLPADIYRKE